MQVIDKTEKNSPAKLTDQFSVAVILDYVCRKGGGAELLRFAELCGINIMFDDTLPERVAALSFIRESRLPQNQEKGTVILLNPRIDETILAEALMEKLHFCRVSRQPARQRSQGPAR